MWKKSGRKTENERKIVVAVGHIVRLEVSEGSLIEETQFCQRMECPHSQWPFTPEDTRYSANKDKNFWLWPFDCRPFLLSRSFFSFFIISLTFNLILQTFSAAIKFQKSLSHIYIMIIFFLTKHANFATCNIF